MFGLNVHLSEHECTTDGKIHDLSTPGIKAAHSTKKNGKSRQEIYSLLNWLLLFIQALGLYWDFVFLSQAGYSNCIPVQFVWLLRSMITIMSTRMIALYRSIYIYVFKTWELCILLPIIRLFFKSVLGALSSKLKRSNNICLGNFLLLFLFSCHGHPLVILISSCFSVQVPNSLKSPRIFFGKKETNSMSQLHRTAFDRSLRPHFLYLSHIFANFK